MKTKTLLLLLILQLLNLPLSAGDSYGIIGRSKFIPLSPGEIKPESWIKKQVDLSVNGLGGLKDILENNVWRKPTEPKGKGPFAWWPYEQQAYFMDGATRLALVAGNKEMQNEVMKTYESAIKRQKDDGYYYCHSDIWHKRWLEKDNGDDRYRWKSTGIEGMHWSHAVFVRGALAEYAATHDPKILEFLRKQFQFYYHKGRDKNKQGTVITGHELYFNRGLVTVESLVDFLRFSDDDKIYKNAVEIFKNNEDGMVRNYLEGHFSNVCHGVTYNELTKLYAAGYILTGNKRYLETAEASYEFIQKNHMLPNGIHSANEFLRGIGGFKNSETCDISDFLWSNIWLLRASGDAKYADRIEKDFYNAAQRAISWDYKTHVYIQAPNRLPNVNPSKHSEYKPVHNPICCSRNLTRILPNFIINATMRTNNGLGILYYIPSDISTDVNGKKVSFNIKTDYPFTEKIVINFNNSSANKFPLKLRIPAWCKSPSLQLNGEKIPVNIEQGFTTITNEWKKGDSIELMLPMTINIHKEHAKIIIDKEGKEPFFGGHGPEIDLPDFKQLELFGYVTRGPLLFSLPVKTADEASLALVPAETEKMKKLIVKELPLADNWTWKTPPVAVEVVLQEIDFKYPTTTKVSKRKILNAHLPQKIYKSDPTKQKKYQLIPYGSTEYRMSAFPIAE